MEENTDDHENALEGYALQLRRKEINDETRNKEEKPESFPPQRNPVDRGKYGHQQIIEPHGPTRECGMMQRDLYRRALDPHVSKKLVPEGCDVEDDHLPQEQSVRPDCHGGLRELLLG